MRAIYLSLALLAAAFAFSPASAAPIAPAKGYTASSSLILARYSSHSKYRHHRHSRYHAGHRYRHAPHGWHRYGSRPYNWSTRGCILVGPVWFCP